MTDLHTCNQYYRVFYDYGREAEHEEPASAVPKSVGAETPAETTGEEAKPDEEDYCLRPPDTTA